MSAYLPVRELRTASWKTQQRTILYSSQCFSRRTSTSAVEAKVQEAPEYGEKTTTAIKAPTFTCLGRLPTSHLLRNIFLGAFFTSPILYKPGFAILRRIANSHSRALSPDANPILRVVLRSLLYDQFCAGTNQAEIFRTRDTIKRIGYSGIILCYGKEIQISKANQMHSTGVASAQNAEIAHWRDGNLETLDMVGSGDWLGMKSVLLTFKNCHMGQKADDSPQIHRSWFGSDNSLDEQRSSSRRIPRSHGRHLSQS